MTTEIRLPQLGESAVEGTIVRWLKQAGDLVARDEPLVEVMTDKVTVEIPSLVGGRVLRLLVEEGATVPIGTPIAEVAPVSEQREERERVSPVVRKLAAEHGVDLTRLRGTGEGGRVTRQDVLAFLANRASQPPDPASRARRRSIAERVTRSYREVPTAWTVQEADVSGMVALRAKAREAFERRTGVRLSYLPFMVHAVIAGLKAVPALNSRCEDDEVVPWDGIHIGVAVALETGLIVPVLRDADRLSFTALACAAADLVDRARAGRLASEEVSGGTFTVNNTGAFGSVLSAPILIAPQAGMVTMEAIVRRPVVVADDAIEVRSLMNLCLTFDHRVLDGATAGRFLSVVRARLEAYGPEMDLEGGSDASTS